MTHDEQKPASCPFCGNGARMLKREVGIKGRANWDWWHSIQCAKCNAAVGYDDNRYRDKTECVKAWNTRTATTRESELLAVIRAMDAKLADAIDLIEREVSSSASQITLPSKDWVGLDGKLVKQYPYQTYDIEAMREARRLAEQVV